MGKVKIKKKSTFIDMTAMSDVTVLLLTFFMLTSTFLQKEPTIVYTPSSVSEEKVPMNNLVTVLVSSADKSGKLDDPTVTEGKLFISFTGDADSTLSSENIRGLMLDEALSIYNEQHKNNKITLYDFINYLLPVPHYQYDWCAVRGTSCSLIDVNYRARQVPRRYRQSKSWYSYRRQQKPRRSSERLPGMA